jgi:hypothetical protein
MNTKTILTLIFLAAVIFLVVSYANPQKEDFQDNLYGQGLNNCREKCTEQHPEAARMSLDGDNDIADEVMGQCVKQCSSQCPSCQ